MYIEIFINLFQILTTMVNRDEDQFLCQIYKSMKDLSVIVVIIDFKIYNIIIDTTGIGIVRVFKVADSTACMDFVLWDVSNIC